jgi:uncharacterized protein (UPF0276 family)
MIRPDNFRADGPAAMPARAGIGLRAPHHDAILAQQPRIGWLEAHSENYFADGGAQLECLERLRSLYPLSLHGVGLSLGSTDPLDRAHLGRLKRLVDRFEPALVSEHLSFSSAGGRFANDLLPLPYTDESLRHVIDRIRQVQDFLGRQILIENISSYLTYACSDISEPEFLGALVFETDCALLLDVNNVYVNAVNHGFDARSYIEAIPRHCVAEIHLAGHSINRHGAIEILIDTHSARVSDAVWSLYDAAVDRFGRLPTLIEWDADLPTLDVLVAEAALAERRTERTHGLAA